MSIQSGTTDFQEGQRMIPLQSGPHRMSIRPKTPCTLQEYLDLERSEPVNFSPAHPNASASDPDVALMSDLCL